jgi:hypothetical protein
MRALLVVFALAASGCGLVGGRCPEPEDLEKLPVAAGNYTEATTASGVPFEGATDIQLVVNRDNDTATLSLTTADGRAVQIDYTLASGSFEF